MKIAQYNGVNSYHDILNHHQELILYLIILPSNIPQYQGAKAYYEITYWCASINIYLGNPLYPTQCDSQIIMDI